MHKYIVHTHIFWGMQNREYSLIEFTVLKEGSVFVFKSAFFNFNNFL